MINNWNSTAQSNDDDTFELTRTVEDEADKVEMSTAYPFSAVNNLEIIKSSVLLVM
jgi:hypothetical protein